MNDVFIGSWVKVLFGFTSCKFVYLLYGSRSNNQSVTFTPTMLLPFVLMWFYGVGPWSWIHLILFVYGFGEISIKLPFRTRITSRLNHAPSYGFIFDCYTNMNISKFIVLVNRKKYVFAFPWVRAVSKIEYHMDEGSWQSVSVKNPKPPKKNVYVEHHPFTSYLPDGTKYDTTATVHIFSSTYTAKWNWILHPIIHKYVDIDLKSPTGISGKIICHLKPTEIPIDVLKMLERTNNYINHEV